MPLIPEEAIPYFENMIYLPMVLTILEKDRTIFEKAPFKLKRPYIVLVEEAGKQVQKELKQTHMYMKRHSMKVLRGEGDDMFTEYVFFHGGYEEHRRYLNVRLRNRVEELLSIYLAVIEKLH
ncbi:hypothetical protein MKY37_16250 [Psychrobacillus sp. FSL K6-2836]|uniref:hypothetical protein n=1 Tax=Psychrobacillus sp. FSL K6-2836 TaxID=2921548 RepID=UPI0030F8A2EB